MNISLWIYSNAGKFFNITMKNHRSPKNVIPPYLSKFISDKYFVAHVIFEILAVIGRIKIRGEQTCVSVFILNMRVFTRSFLECIFFFCVFDFYANTAFLVININIGDVNIKSSMVRKIILYWFRMMFNFYVRYPLYFLFP